MAGYDPTAKPAPSFFFADAPPGSPLSYQALQTRRKIAEALLSKRSPFPKTLGEGLTYGSERLTDALELKRLEEQQRAFDVQGGKDVQDAAKLSGISPSSTMAPDRRTDAGDADVPYVPSSLAADAVPLPPPRPVVDRSPIINDANDPNVMRRQAAITLGEANPGASLAELQTQYATPMDRALATGQSLPGALRTYTGPRSGGYYPAQAIARGEQALQAPGAYEAFVRDVATPVLRGADPGRAMLGFTPTQNASNAPGNAVAANGIRNKTYNQYAPSPTGELFATKPGERPPTPFPAGGPDLGGPDVAAGTPPDATEQGRDAIAEAAMAGAQPPASNARVASLGGGGPLGNAGAASAVIPPTLAPAPPSPVPGGPAAAVAPLPPIVPQGNPPIMAPNITPRPKVAQAQPPVPPMATPQYPPPRIAEDIPQPKPTPQTPMTNEEKLARLQMMHGAATGNQPKYDTYKAAVEELAARRAFIDKQNAEADKAALTQWTADTAARQAASRERAKMQAEGKLPEPVLPIAPDPNIGTPQSQQRKGYPDLPPVPAGVRPEKHAEAQMPLIIKAQEAVRSAIPQFDEMIKAIDLARNHPGKDAGTGALGKVARSIHGTDAYGFGTIVDQLKGKNFLSGYQLLRSAGPAGNISNIEGTKTEQAQARIDPNQTKKGFDSALNDLELQVRGDLELAQRRMNMPVTAWRRAGDNSSFAPDIGQRDGNMEYVGGRPSDPNSWRRAR